VQFEFSFGGKRPVAPGGKDWLRVGSRTLRLRLIRNRRARRYILRLNPDGAARVTIPRGGSVGEAMRFTRRNMAWLEKQLLRLATKPLQPQRWTIGSQVLFRGQPVRLQAGENGDQGVVCFGSEILRISDATGDLRPHVERHLWKLAARELPGRVMELANLHQLPVKRVSVRNQRSRWGSCSRHGTISLNWRLVQAPVFVRDYIILHELAHLKEMNHSPRFWREVARLCPDFGRAEQWLKKHSAADLQPH
jgi:predicted metal-dependent hydrolase